MNPSTIEPDVTTIIATGSAAPSFDNIQAESVLADVGFDPADLVARLGLPGLADGATVAELMDLVTGAGESVRDELWAAATEARVTRLVQGILLATRWGALPDEPRRWWYGLAGQVLWWYARSDAEGGVDLAQRATPARAQQALTGMGLLEVSQLAKDDADNAVSVVDVLERIGYPDKTATRVYQALVRIAQVVTEKYDGKVQRALRDHADHMVDAVSADLLSTFDDPAFLREAVRGWISTSTSLPVLVWSPSTRDFVDKFEASGVSGDVLTRVADEVDTDMLALDTGLADFMEALCRGCDPDREEDQRCVRRFGATGLDVECPARPDLAAAVREGVASG